MFIKRFCWSANGIRIFFMVCFFSFIISCSLFAVLNNRAKFGLLIIDYSTHISIILNGKHDQCVINECTDEQSRKHGDLFASFKPDWSGCYADFYLLAFDNNQTPVEVLIDVGANKGYAVATWLAFFLPQLQINQNRLGSYIQSTRDLSESCGSCNDCADEPFTSKNIKEKVKLQIHAFEPQPGTVEILKDIQKWMNVSGKSDSMFEIHGMAVSDQTGQALFRLCNAGNEVCSLDVSSVSNDSQIYVNITTLDDFADRYHLSKIDILKIDTEGYEPLVFRGAKALLQQHRIRLFIFEHLEEGVWRNTSLQIEISNLSKIGYVCYVIGRTGVIRVSHCWNEQFNVRHNNLLCVSSKDRQLLNNIDRMRLPESIPITCQTERTR